MPDNITESVDFTKTEKSKYIKNKENTKHYFLRIKLKLIKYRVFQKFQIVVRNGGTIGNFAWSVCVWGGGYQLKGTKSIKLKQNGTGAMTTGKNAVSIGL